MDHTRTAHHKQCKNTTFWVLQIKISCSESKNFMHLVGINDLEFDSAGNMHASLLSELDTVERQLKLAIIFLTGLWEFIWP